MDRDRIYLPSSSETPDVVVVGYITSDTIVNIDENLERHPYHACGGVSTYFSIVSSALGYTTGIITPVGEDFYQDYLSGCLLSQRHGVTKSRLPRLRTVQGY